ncbi:YafY family transcriptional regulator [Listeria welshimeri]|uniref:helix-turn-helix transcriptional regulator n=1 Tax=Listeria welshimeri TaxID=1643 RepID=UPI00162A76A7|nr:YafY family protein [Listeria welshimeri]MBC1497909.1 YafY family transcriptional regulator [Listeria welshimeri]MBC1519504.1 YafY family transcriptional regulator [Listeria welshimeri]MBC1602463.1 YafY family transcriptional regulator [Listeria welshimeri]MBC1818627.1 YafY family transcriptional regulator [Listeria welshimeri]MBC2016251.1 YafY family transcriptional regulator [Listeria welshimeri]
MKIERLIGIIMLLLQRELVSASEMATMFEVSKRTIFRDIDTLMMANIPIYTIAGTKGGIGIMPTYKVDKKLLTAEDLTAIIASLDGMEQLLSSAETKKTLQKMKNMLDHSSEPPKSSISLDFSNLSMKKELNAKVESLYLAIKKHHLVELSYIDRAGKQTIRRTEPYHLLFRNRSWYLQGYSLERNDFRTFKMSRIVELKTLEETFEARPFVVKPFGGIPNTKPMFLMHEVTLMVDKIAREQIVERFDTIEITQQDEDHFLAKVSLPDHEAGYRFLLQLGTHVTIQNRDDFYDNFVEYLKEIQEKYI